MRDVECLRIFFFSDWRIQPLDLAEELIHSVAPVDLIVYGGDDVSRFVSAHDRSETLTGSEEGCTHTPLARGLADTVAPPLHDSVNDNWLSKIASSARYGVVAIVGNDCHPYHRTVLTAPGVRDIHATPVVIGGWGFIGIEGAIYRGDTNRIGHILHADGDALEQHVARACASLAVSPERIVIVSHTPPAGCRLDYAIRFGFNRLGSETLRDFVLEKRPALVLSGHCHCRGGKHAYVGTTLVVNGASDDTRIQGTRASLIELDPNGPSHITWLDPMPFTVMSVPDVGVKRAEVLRSYGITTPTQLFDASAEVFAAIQFGPIRKARLYAHARAMAENLAVWLEKPTLPEKMLFYDVETGLNVGDPFGLGPPEPWMIAISDGNEMQQWIVPTEDRTARKDMYRGLLKYVQNYPGYTLCSYSGSNFDNRAVEAGMMRWHKRGLKPWRALPKRDLLCILKQCLALPTRSWALKETAEWCGYRFSATDLDGFEVGLFYECYHRLGEALPVEDIARYNAEDVRALAWVAQWVQKQEFG